jgi:hypothetical protein
MDNTANLPINAILQIGCTIGDYECAIKRRQAIITGESVSVEIDTGFIDVIQQALIHFRCSDDGEVYTFTGRLTDIKTEDVLSHFTFDLFDYRNFFHQVSDELALMSFEEKIG